MALAPIALFVYKRLAHTRQTVDALRANDLAAESDLFVFSDAAKTEADSRVVAEVREYVNSLSGFKSVHVSEKENNCGLANSIIAGVTQLCESFGRVIVVEDDIVTSPYFLSYMNRALDFYADYPRVFSISAYNISPKFMPMPSRYKHDVAFSKRSSPWGWATWLDRWRKANWDYQGYREFLADEDAVALFNLAGSDMSGMLNAFVNGRNNSWWIRWCYTCHMHGAVSLFPRISFVDNIGDDGTGTHVGGSLSWSRNDLAIDPGEPEFILPVYEDPEVAAVIRRFWSTRYRSSLPRRLVRLAKRVILSGRIR